MRRARLALPTLSARQTYHDQPRAAPYISRRQWRADNGERDGVARGSRRFGREAYHMVDNLSRFPVALTPGTRLGAYEIIAPIGKGGMGEVYRARDTKLGRDVAIKVLPEAVAREQERLARFEREGRTLAALNHPNIAIIHGLEDTNGVRALVMALVEGPTLADRIALGPVPPAEALSIARQIVEALDAAH